MRNISYWLFAIAATGFLGALLPWFKPSVPGAKSNTWHSWDDGVGLLPLAVALVAGAMGFALSGVPASKSLGQLSDIARRADKMVWLPVLGLAACIWVAVRLPSEDVLQTCYGSICGGADSSWIDAAGASRGVQFGFVLSVLSTVMGIGVGLTLLLRAEQFADYLVGSDPADEHDHAAPAAPPKVMRSNVLPDGERACRRLNCTWRGVPVDHQRCASCDHPTVLLAGHDMTLMSAPGVVYDASYVPPPLERARTVSAPQAGDEMHDPEAVSATGIRVCRRLNCGERGVLVDSERCHACEHPTIARSEYRDILFSSPGVPVPD